MVTLRDIVKPDVLALAPELTLSDQGWVEVLTYVNELDLSSLGESVQVTRMARIYLAAHLGTVGRLATTGGGTAVSGPVTSEAVGQVRRTYATTGSGSTQSATSTNLEATMYGQMYMRIIGMSAARGPLVA